MIHFLKISFSFRRTNKTWFFSRSNDSWAPGPDLIQAMKLHQCESFIDVTSNGIWLVVSETVSNRKFQFLDFNQEPHEWIEGPSLPAGNDLSDGCLRLVSSGTYLHFINTCTGEIFELECAVTCHWTLQQQTLKYSRRGAVVSLIPDRLTDCS